MVTQPQNSEEQGPGSEIVVEGDEAREGHSEHLNAVQASLFRF
jgi:hypothetical protein